MKEKFDVVIIGGGPGGYVAAIRAAQLKLKVALVEKEHLGGICLNWGCIPTKALLRVSEVLHTCKHAEQFGITVGKVDFDLAKMVKYSRDVADRLAKGVAGLMKKNGVKVFEGYGKIAGKGKVSITISGKDQQIEASNIIIATGARPRELPTIKFDGKMIWNYKQAMTPDKLPKKLLIVGSGAIGVEFASFYNMLGVEVTIMEISKEILSNEDIEVSTLVHKLFEKRGIKILTKTEVVQTNPKGDVVLVKFRDEKGLVHDTEFDRVISAVGVVANTENIGLETTKVKLERGVIKTNEYLETDEPKVFAIGDVASAPWLAHKASHEAIICVEKIAGLKPHAMKRENIPACTYSYPQIASIGLTEAAAKEKYKDIKVGRFPFYANGKAIAMGETDGFVKTIFDPKTGELLGAHLVGAEVTEMIQGFAIAKNMEATEEEIMHTIFPHPTISESMHESVLDAFARVIHL
ncbi:MAG: dihydrolipoyl dehydrogenase [Candidatus Jidaibacter sp.]|jgi:dihydrolipoamide dehydrogenase|nr:dihydrolipoyl dehydrogenase [Candidatus Jidaibacter sp.]